MKNIEIDRIGNINYDDFLLIDGDDLIDLNKMRNKINSKSFLKRTMKKIIFKLTEWYILDLVNQQNQINIRLSKGIESLKRDINKI